MKYIENVAVYKELVLSNLTELSIATVVIILTVAALFGFSLRYGKDRIIALIISIYIGLLVFLHFPYTEKLLFLQGSDSSILLSRGIVYLGFVLLVYIVIEKVIWAEYPNGVRRYLDAFTLSLTAAALLLALAYNILPIASFYALDPSLEM